MPTDGKCVLTMVLCPIEPRKAEKGRGSKEAGRKAAISYRTVRGTAHRKTSRLDMIGMPTEPHGGSVAGKK